MGPFPSGSNRNPSLTTPCCPSAGSPSHSARARPQGPGTQHASPVRRGPPQNQPHVWLPLCVQHHPRASMQEILPSGLLGDSGGRWPSTRASSLCLSFVGFLQCAKHCAQRRLTNPPDDFVMWGYHLHFLEEEFKVQKAPLLFHSVAPVKAPCHPGVKGSPSPSL